MEEFTSYEAKVNQLIESGKLTHFLTYKEVVDALAEYDLDSEQMDDIFLQFAITKSM